MKQKNGFSLDEIKWSVATGRGSGITLQYPGGRAYNAGYVATHLSNGYPVIAEIIYGAYTHFVVITGQIVGSYYINDPINGKQIVLGQTYNGLPAKITQIYEYQGQYTVTPVSLYRYDNPNGHGDHYYTTNINELGTTNCPAGYIFAGIPCYVYSSQIAGTVPLYRYFNQSIGIHYYSTSLTDLSSIGYDHGAIACYVYPVGNYTDPNIVPMFHYYNPLTYAHYYTDNFSELGYGNCSFNSQWNYGGPAFYVHR